MEQKGSGGQVESLWGRINISDMGSKVTREKPAIGANVPSSKGLTKSAKSLLETASSLTGSRYRPRSRETMIAWEYLLAFVGQRLLGDVDREILAAATEECLVILKTEHEEMSEGRKKVEIEKSLGVQLSAEIFSQLDNLVRRITDFIPASAKHTTDGAPDVQDDEDEVAVVFGDEEEDEEALLGEDGDNEEVDMDASIPIIRMQNAEFSNLVNEDANEEEEEVNKAMSTGDSNFGNLSKVDLESMAFPNGGHTMTNKKCLVPEKSTKISKTGYEEIHIPAPTPRPLTSSEHLIPITNLPSWAIPAFEGFTGQLNRIQSRICSTALESDDNFLLCAPTGAGKTNVALLAMLHEIGKHCSSDSTSFAIDKSKASSFKIIYIAPMKALVQEMVNSFGKRLESYGLTVAELSGDQTLSRAQIDGTNVIVTTPEKWDIITRKNIDDMSWTRLVRLVVIDEIHLLHDDRGPVLEAIVARTHMQNSTSHLNVRLVGLSATLPNYLDVGRFLRVERRNIFYFDATYRPCPLSQQFVGITERKPLQRMQLMNTITYEKVMERVGKCQVIVFVHSRKDTAKTAKFIRDQFIAMGTISKLLSQPASTKEALSTGTESTRNNDLGDLLSYGIGIHHAGMTRNDRNLVEELFGNSHLQILVSTATLAWGVNLPAHTVIIKGTQVYNAEKGRWCELSSQDVLQMLGRAGRPQYDTEGEGIIITSHSEVQFYLSLLNQQLPIESQLISKLVDHLNAEVVLGTISSRNDAVEWLSFSYLFVRILKDPLIYGVTPELLATDPTLLNFRHQLVHSAAEYLHEKGLVRYDSQTGTIKSTEQGRIASYFYISADTMGTFIQHLKPGSTEIDFCRIFAQSSEFKLIPVRQEEKLELQQLSDKVPLPLRENFDEPLAKINILLQSYISRLTLDGFSLAADMIYVSQSAGRILRAIFELCLRRGWATAARRALDLCQMVAHRQWRSQSPLRQGDCFGLSSEIIRKLERKDFPWDKLFDLDSHELGELVRLPSAGKLIHSALRSFPRVKCNPQLIPITKDLIRVDIEITPTYVRKHGREAFWLMIEDVDGEALLFADSFLIFGDRPTFLSAYITISEPMPPCCYLTIIADRWLGSETRVPIMLRNLVLSEKRSAPFESSPTEGPSINTIQEAFSSYPDISSVYCEREELSEVERETFLVLFKSDQSMFIGHNAFSTPLNQSTILCVEAPIWRMLIQDTTAKCVYLVPDRESLNNNLECSLKTRFKDFTVRTLTGDVNADLKHLEQANIVLSDARSWDQISRRWKSRKNVQNISLVIMDGVHLMLNCPEIEVCLARMRSMAAQLERDLRFVVLGLPIWNARELTAWLGIQPECCFNWDSAVGGNSKIALLSVMGVGNETAAVKPAWRQIKNRRNCLVWVADSNIANSLAIDLSLLAARLGDEEVMAAVSINSLMSAEEKLNIIDKFKNGAIKCLIAPKSFSKEASTLIDQVEVNLIVGTQEWCEKERTWTDYPLATLLALIHEIPSIEGTIILCQPSRRTSLLTLLSAPLPLESSLDSALIDTINAEIAVRSIRSRQDCIDYITWSYLYRRLARNPNFYGLEAVGQRALSEYLSELVEDTINELIEMKCIEVDSEVEGEEDEDEDSLLPTNLGLIAAYYGIKCTSVAHFASSLTSSSRLRGLIQVLSESKEFAQVAVRKGEIELMEALNSVIPFKLESSIDFSNPHIKVFLLLQAHFSRIKLSNELLMDLHYVLINCISLVQGMVDVCSSYGFLAPAIIAMECSQMAVQAVWNSDNPVVQLISDPSILDSLDKMEITSIYDIDDQVLGKLSLSPEQLSDVISLYQKYPSVEVDYNVEYGEESSDAAVKATVTRSNPLRGPVPASRYPSAKEEAWWLIVGIPTNGTLLGVKRFMIPAEGAINVSLNFSLPEEAGQYDAKVYLVSDCWLGADQEFDLPLNTSS